MKLFNACIVLVFVFVLLQSFEGLEHSKRRKDGTEPGYTGSPGDSFKNCTACHGGLAQNIDGWITSNIPSSGWEPNKRYTITATNTEVGATRFGFEVSPQALNGQLLGELIVTDTAATQLVGDNKYVTYRAAGVDGVDSRSWSFDWIAPDSTISEVGFYGAFNSNFEGHKEGDKTFLSILKVYRAGHQSSINSNIIDAIQLCPNPSNHLVSLSFNLKESEKITIQLKDLTGKTIETFTDSITLSSGSQNFTYSLKDIQSGIYFIHIISAQVSSFKKLIVNK